MTDINMTLNEIVIVSPRGFCAGVERAVKMVERALKQFAPPLYCRRAIVHNHLVVSDLSARGVVFVEELHEVPVGGTVVFSAHGVAPSVHEEARQRGLHVIDATCPFVSKVHNEVKHSAAAGFQVLLIGHPMHDEIVGIVGEAPADVTVIQNAADARNVSVRDPDKVAVMTQTTLGVDETSSVMNVLRNRFPQLRLPTGSDICYATRNRQLAAQHLAEQTDYVLVLGATNSSNTNRLVEVVRTCNKPVCLIGCLEDVDRLDLRSVRTLGVTAGASTPEYFVQAVVERVHARAGGIIRHLRAADEVEPRLTIPRIL